MTNLAMGLIIYSQNKHYCRQRPNIALCRQFKTQHSVKNYILRVQRPLGFRGEWGPELPAIGEFPRSSVAPL